MARIYHGSGQINVLRDTVVNQTPPPTPPQPEAITEDSLEDINEIEEEHTKNKKKNGKERI